MSLAEDLKEEVRSAPNPKIVDPKWREIYDNLRNDILENDPASFLRWMTVLRSLHIGAGKASRSFYNELKKRKDFKYWSDVFGEVKVGNPTLLPWDKRASGTSVAHAIHMAKFQDHTGLKIAEMKHIFEFGGGYGSMRRMIDRMGFEGDYIIYDMPVITALQRYYLGTLGVEVGLTSDLDEVEALIKDFDPEQSLFIATASLSETPYELRDKVKPMIWGYQGMMISFIHVFQELDNIAYFKQWHESEDYRWTWMRSDQTRRDRAYLFGVKKLFFEMGE